MSEVATTRLLADMPGVIPTLAIWYKAEWADWFANTSLDEIEADFHTVATRDKLPFAAVALDKDMQPLGVCSVRDESFEPYPDAGPWLRGLYVHTPHRGSGIAGQLIEAAARHAAQLQVMKLYAATHTAIGTFERAGWLGFDQVLHQKQMLTIFATRVG
jgi:GNAT superfamily N-acetyltransferase